MAREERTRPEEIERRREEVLAQISSAFDGVSRGDGVSLHQALAYDDMRPEEEALREREKDTESRWQDLDDDLLEDTGQFAINFFDDESYQYYLPAFLRLSLRRGEHSDSFTYDVILYSLGMRMPLGEEYRICCHLESLNEQQRRAVSAWLAFLRDCFGDEDAREALDEFWDKYL